MTKMMAAAWILFFRRSGIILTAAIFLIGLLLAATGALWWQHQIDSKAAAIFERGVERVASAVIQRFYKPVYGLNGAKGMYATSESVQRAAFLAYVESRDLPVEFPGVRGFGFIQRVMRADIDPFLAAARADGAPQFAIRQLVTKNLDDLYVIKYIEPAVDNVGSLGLDIGSEPNRRIAAQLAVDTGEPTITAAINLVQDDRESPGVLLYVPVYANGAHPTDVKARRASLVGLVYAPIVIAELLDDIPTVVTRNFNFQVIDGSPEAHGGTRLYDTNVDIHKQTAGRFLSAYSVSRSLGLPGRELTLRVASTPEFDAATDHSTPWIIFASGTLLSALLSLLLWQQATGRRRAEAIALSMTKQLRLDEERSRDFSKCASDWFWETDAQHLYCYFSDNFQNVHDLDPSLLLGKRRVDVLDIYQLNPPELVNAHLVQMDAHQPFKNFEYQIRGADGLAKWISLSGLPHIDADGRFAGYRGTGSIINERKHAEEALRKAGVFQSAIYNSVNFFSIATDTNGVIQTFNVGAEHMLGYAAVEVINRISLVDIADHQETVDRAGDRSVEPGVPIASGFDAMVVNAARGVEDIYELNYIRKNGLRQPVLVSVTVLRDEAAAVIGYLFIGTDNTARKQAERALIDAKNAAERANRAKSDFLAAMSHEIRTPMNGVIGMVDVLHQTSLKGYQVEMVDIIRESAFSLLAIIDDVLDFSKIEAGKLNIESVPISVADVLEKACDMLTPLAIKKDVELMLFTDPALPANILGDALRLRQIVINLANNAIKFTSGQGKLGRVAVRATLVECGPGLTALEIRVIDNGIGMNEATQERLFTAFTQADLSTTRRFGGTGLGLAIAHNLAGRMGGAITVQSTLGVGSTFTVRLPCAALEPVQANDSASQPLTGLRCLLVGGIEEANDLGSTLLADLAAYLAAGGAWVAHAPNLKAAREISVRTVQNELGPWLWLWLVDGRAAPLSADALRAIAHERPTPQTHLIVLDRGRRRRLRQLADTEPLFALDVNALRRQTFLDAVAVVIGRAPERGEIGAADRAETTMRLPTRAQAQRLQRLILVAEDNETNQHVILRQLELLGYVADIASNGREALQRWESGDYALLLTDLHMPEMDGYELVVAIREIERNDRTGLSHIPIVALTANALKDEAERCIDVGMDDYLAKPASLDQLRAMMAKWLQPHTSAAASVPAVSIAQAQSIDISVLAGLIGDDPVTLRKILLDFRRVSTVTTADIRAACAAGNSHQVGELAHKLKSSARAVGALVLGDICAELEAAGKDGASAAVTQLADKLEAEMVVVEAELERSTMV